MLKKNVVLLVIGLCIITYLLGIFLIPLMDIDAAQYASISREMYVHKSF
jgi:4-amino-4-deoxy-L-arabinose transferase-like glycosyltransferase